MFQMFGVIILLQINSQSHAEAADVYKICVAKSYSVIYRFVLSLE